MSGIYFPNISAESLTKSSLTHTFFIASRESKSGISDVTASVFIVTFRSAKIPGNSCEAIDVNTSPLPNLNTLIPGLCLIFERSVSLREDK